MKLVIEATIKPIKRHQLKIDDEILWSNIRCVITKVPLRIEDREVEFIYVEDAKTVGYKPSLNGDYVYWYKILTCKEINVCNHCFGTEVPEGVNYCKICLEDVEVDDVAVQDLYGG